MLAVPVCRMTTDTVSVALSCIVAKPDNSHHVLVGDLVVAEVDGLERRRLLNGLRQRLGAIVRDLVIVEVDVLERRGLLNGES